MASLEDFADFDALALGLAAAGSSSSAAGAALFVLRCRSAAAMANVTASPARVATRRGSTSAPPEPSRRSRMRTLMRCCDSTSRLTTTFIGQLKTCRTIFSERTLIDREPYGSHREVTRTSLIASCVTTSLEVRPVPSVSTRRPGTRRIAPAPQESSQIIITGAQRCPANEAITPDDEPVSSHAGFTRVA